MMSYTQALAQPMLSPEEEIDLVERWRRDGDKAARDRLVRSHMRLCYAVASRYDSNEEHIRDLAQEGVFGLMKAVEKYESHHGTRFSTYARWWVMEHVSRSISKVATIVDMPPRTYLEARGAGVEDDDIGWQARQAARGEVPLDALVGEDGETAVIDLIPDKRPNPEASALAADRDALFKRSVAEGLGKAMSEREADVIRRRMLSESPSTLEHIAADYGVSRERIRQIEAGALEKLRRYLVNAGFPRGILRE